MISRETVLVLGAGASAPYHFPLGTRLIKTDPDVLRAEGAALFATALGCGHDKLNVATMQGKGNVLRAQREPWLVVDPKPFVGDRAYDATQHLFNCKARLSEAPRATIRRFADLLDVDEERVRMWMFARLAAEPRDSWTDDASTLARALE